MIKMHKNRLFPNEKPYRPKGGDSFMPEDWKKIEELFNSVIKLEPGARPAFLDHACKGDASLREKVESLIASEEKANEDGLLNSPAQPDFNGPVYRLTQLVGRV